MSALPALFLALAAPSVAAPPADTLAAIDIVHEVTLVSPGAEPRQQIRYRPKPGTVTFEQLTRSKMDMSMTLPDGQSIAAPVPPTPSLVLTTRQSIGEPVANGLVPVRVEQVGGRVEGQAAPEVVAAMTASLEQLKGLAFDLFLDGSGKPVQLDVTGGGDPAMAQALQGFADQMTDRLASFPDEPVGVGAKWTSDVGMSLGGFDVVTTQTATVTEISPASVTLAMTMTMAMDGNGATMPGLPPGASVDIVTFTGQGSGTSRVDLETLVATGVISFDVDTVMNVGVPGQPPMGVSMKMHQSTESRLAK